MESQQFDKYLSFWQKLCEPNKKDNDFLIVHIGLDKDGKNETGLLVCGEMYEKTSYPTFDNIVWLDARNVDAFVGTVHHGTLFGNDIALQGIEIFQLSKNRNISAEFLRKYFQTDYYYTIWFYLLARQAILNANRLPDNFIFKDKVNQATSFFNNITTYFEKNNFDIPQYNKHGPHVLPQTPYFHKSYENNWNINTWQEYIRFLYSEMLYIKEYYQIICEFNHYKRHHEKMVREEINRLIREGKFHLNFPRLQIPEEDVKK